MTRRSGVFRWLMVLSVGVLVAGCTPEVSTPEGGVSPTVVSSPTAYSPTPTPTQTPIPAPTLTPTPTPAMSPAEQKARDRAKCILDLISEYYTDPAVDENGDGVVAAHISGGSCFIEDNASGDGDIYLKKFDSRGKYPGTAVVVRSGGHRVFLPVGFYYPLKGEDFGPTVTTAVLAKLAYPNASSEELEQMLLDIFPEDDSFDTDLSPLFRYWIDGDVGFEEMFGEDGKGHVYVIYNPRDDNLNRTEMVDYFLHNNALRMLLGLGSNRILFYDNTDEDGRLMMDSLAMPRTFTMFQRKAGVQKMDSPGYYYYEKPYLESFGFEFFTNLDPYSLVPADEEDEDGLPIVLSIGDSVVDLQVTDYIEEWIGAVNKSHGTLFVHDPDIGAYVFRNLDNLYPNLSVLFYGVEGPSMPDGVQDLLDELSGGNLVHNTYEIGMSFSPMPIPLMSNGDGVYVTNHGIFYSFSDPRLGYYYDNDYKILDAFYQQNTNFGMPLDDMVWTVEPVEDGSGR